MRSSTAGVTLIELMIAILVLGLGVVATLSVMMTTGVNNEISKEQALSYKACQDTTEALMAMDYASMINPNSYTLPAGRPAPVNLGTRHFKAYFLVKKPLAFDQWIGEFTIRDVTTSYDTMMTASSAQARASFIGSLPNWTVCEIIVKLKVRKTNVELRTWRRSS